MFDITLCCDFCNLRRKFLCDGKRPQWLWYFARGFQSSSWLILVWTFNVSLASQLGCATSPSFSFIFQTRAERWAPQVMSASCFVDCRSLQPVLFVWHPDLPFMFIALRDIVSCNLLSLICFNAGTWKILGEGKAYIVLKNSYLLWLICSFLLSPSVALWLGCELCLWLLRRRFKWCSWSVALESSNRNTHLGTKLGS